MTELLLIPMLPNQRRARKMPCFSPLSRSRERGRG
jgi:hypothetical protein